MQYQYILQKNENGDVVSIGIVGKPLTSIPCDPANTDYQAFLAWVAEGNAPLPPDEPPVETP